MKKIITIIFMVVLFLLFSVSAFAASRDKVVDVSLSASSLIISPGQTVILTASTKKHGSSFTDLWENTLNQNTFFDRETGTYISTSEFTAQIPGTYTIIYNISMHAGKSDTSFTGGSQIVIEVKADNPPSVIGADIRNLVFEDITDSTGRLLGCSATGDIYILYSDNTSVYYESIFVFMNSTEYTKSIRASILIDQNLYDFDLQLVR